MTAANPFMLAMVIGWVSLVTVTINRTLKRGSVGLPAALLLAMSFLYGGCFVYAIPGYTHLRVDALPALLRYDFSDWLVVRATFVSLLAVTGFSIGVGVFRRSLPVVPRRECQFRLDPSDRRGSILRKKYMTVLVVFGAGSYVATYFDVSFPLSKVLFEVGRNALVVALALGAYLARQRNMPLLPWFFASALIPLYYFVLFGFLSYGFLVGCIFYCFWLAVLRKRQRWAGWKSLALNLVILYALLTLFVAWMSYRDEFRAVIWQKEGGSLSDVMVEAAKGTALFSPFNSQALDLVNFRLNLNIFIGRMIEHHENHPELRQYGATLYTLPLVVLPRFLWPGKPLRGGSDFMEEHTGMVLSESATFGAGSAFEFYVNFGMAGVFCGFALIGWLVGRVDRIAASSLYRGRYMDFARLYCVGIVAIDPLLRPFFILNGALFSWLILTAFKILAQQPPKRPTSSRGSRHGAS